MNIDNQDLALLTGIEPAISDRKIAIVSFEGWLDAGSAASTATKYLADTLHLDIVESLDVSEYVDYQVKRPVLARINGERVINWPTLELLGFIPDTDTIPETDTTNLPSDAEKLEEEELPSPKTVALDGTPITNIYIVNGFEPAIKWQEYSDNLATLLKTWKIDFVVAVESLYSDAPHNRPVPVYKTSESKDLRQDFDAKQSEYEGPCGINSILDMALADLNIPTLHIIAQVPHYSDGNPWPKATVALLDMLEETLNIVIPRGELLDTSQFFVDYLNNAMQQNEHMAAYVEHLEQQHDELASTTDTGEKLVEEFRQLLDNQELASDDSESKLSESSESENPDSEDSDS